MSEGLIFKHFPTKAALYAETRAYCRQADAAMALVDNLPVTTQSLVALVELGVRRLGFDRTEEGDERRRLLLGDLLEDGEFARSLWMAAQEKFVSKLEALLDAAEAAGELSRGPIARTNLWWFIHHVGAMIGFSRLPAAPSIAYIGDDDELVRQAVVFALRGAGVREHAIKRYYP